MKIYRCVLGVLLVFFITLAVIIGFSYYSERRSIEEGILILEENRSKEYMLREEGCVLR